MAYENAPLYYFDTPVPYFENQADFDWLVSLDQDEVNISRIKAYIQPMDISCLKCDFFRHFKLWLQVFTGECTGPPLYDFQHSYLLSLEATPDLRFKGSVRISAQVIRNDHSEHSHLPISLTNFRAVQRYPETFSHGDRKSVV